MQRWFIDMLRHKYADFSGRASRKEYWMFFLWNFLLAIALPLSTLVLTGNLTISFSYSLLVYLGLLTPNFAIVFRRMHDLDKSALWLLLLMIPFIGWIIVIVFLASKGTVGPNRFGEDPLVATEILVPVAPSQA